jgi:hypothetical protein
MCYTIVNDNTIKQERAKIHEYFDVLRGLLLTIININKNASFTDGCETAAIRLNAFMIKLQSFHYSFQDRTMTETHLFLCITAVNKLRGK